MQGKPVYTVMIVDDHPLMRQGLQQLLSLDPALKLIAETNDGHEAVTLACDLEPDLIILDLNMKILSGEETLKKLRAAGVDARIVVLTVSDARNDIFALVRAGADGYLLKDSDPEELLEKIKQAVTGDDAVYSDMVAQQLADREDEADADPFHMLTEREHDVLKEVARGLSNKQIATELAISEETVKVHIRNLLRKLNVRSRVAATVLYLESKRH